jgi:acyl transferase domain-containing protein/surfactin synthase thioesterase subunit/NAD(P)-dependent dehydrogenase (short-subunit alcohol dehydrogenase family)/aryl carrier-like protein
VIDDINPSNRQSLLPWKNAGVYLITGGAGELGLIISREIASRVQGAILVLVGRSPLSEERASRIESIKRECPGVDIEYGVLDVAIAADVFNCIDSIVKRYGRLSGIVHAAGIIRDNFILKKSAAEFAAVLAPKVAGTVNLDLGSRAFDLDCFILFSSVAAVFGNLGQSDYATANAFMDRYAQHRNDRLKREQKKGGTLSVNWPLWESGGMQMDAATREKWELQGLRQLPAAEGFLALYRIWQSGTSQAVVLAGDVSALRRNVAEAVSSPTQMVTDETPRDLSMIRTTTSDLRTMTAQFLGSVVSRVLKLPEGRIEMDADFESYGVDSISAMKLVTELERVVGPLPKTLTFEYQHIEALTDYLVENHSKSLLFHLLKGNETPVSRPQSVSHSVPTIEKEQSDVRVIATNNRATITRSQRQTQLIDAGDAGPRSFDIAIVGLSGRYPQARSVEEFWDNLKMGRDCITEIPSDRWDYREYFDPQKGKLGKSYCKWGGFIDGVAQFDPLFFGISRREALAMDPQERLFLQCVYETLEDAGYTQDSLRSEWRLGREGNVGVFVGVMYEEYQLYGAQAQARGAGFAVGGNPSSIANRVSYFFNFHGPSLAVDTMCSSSLTAIHLACQSLRSHGCELAIAGGVNISIHPNKYLGLSQGQFASSTGRCESFGKGGDGYVPGEGVGAILIKPLDEAVADGDHIYGLIKGSSINHGGKTNGYSVPNPRAQAQVISAALEGARIDSRQVSYVEAHGTGTSLGDPIEIAGLTKAFANSVGETNYCAIGSAKSNIGHLESAAGIAGLTKVLLQLKHRMLVPSLHSAALNPHIDFSSTPFRVQQVLDTWNRPVVESDGEKQVHPRIAGVSSFGAGGANAHIVIEEYCEGLGEGLRPTQISQAHPALVVLSAKNEERLQERAGQLLAHIRTHGCTDAELGDIAYTLQVGREAMGFRIGIIATTMGELEDKLLSYVEREAEGEEWGEYYLGEVKKNREALSIFNKDEALQHAIETWIKGGEYAKLLELWVKGLVLDWRKLYGKGSAYGDDLPRRVSLPTYPFARERFWASDDLRQTGDTAINPRASEAGSSGKTGEEYLVPRASAAADTKPRGILLSSLQPSSPTGHDLVVRNGHDTVRKSAAQIDTTIGAVAHGQNNPVQRTLGAVQDRFSVAEPDYPKTTVHATRDSIGTIEIDLTQSLATALYMDIEEIDTDKPFMEFGLDSIVGVEWVRAINTRYSLAINATLLYTYPTISTLARQLASELSLGTARINQSVSTQPTGSVEGSARTESKTDLDCDIGGATTRLPEQHKAENGTQHAGLETASDTYSANPARRPPDIPGKSRLDEPASNMPSNSNAREAPQSELSEASFGISAASGDRGIAIIGMSGMYPSAPHLDTYWYNLTIGLNSVDEVPDTRWDKGEFFDPKPGLPGKTYCKWLAALPDIDCFDAQFFNISPAEAEGMDPQQRLFLEQGYKAFQDAGYSSMHLSNRMCGVYLGIMSSEYGLLLHQRGAHSGSGTGNSAAIAAARIAYYLNLKGPAIPIDTACSSSLVATHLACQALRSGEIEMALAGGVNLYLLPESYIGMSGALMLSPDGRCKAFDNRANGFVPGEGVGAVVLKRLNDAERAGDHIYGVIVGSGINQDGKTNGITAPSAASQSDLIKDIYTRYQINPESITYVETHGTGTKLGDPIELHALASAFSETTEKRHFCAIGSAKTNIGHTSAAAGIAGLHKVLLLLKNRQLVPSLNFMTPNEHFDFSSSPFFVNTEFRDWSVPHDSKRRAALSSFGFSGTNAHMVIEEYSNMEPSDSLLQSGHEGVLIVLSARSEERLKLCAQELACFIGSPSSAHIDLEDLAYTLQIGRDAMTHRLALVANTTQRTIEALAHFANDEADIEVLRGRAAKNNEADMLLSRDEDVAELLTSWINKKKLKKLARLWVRGHSIDWNELHRDRRRKRTPLPTYPFARDRHWVAKRHSARESVARSRAMLHPLLHRNTSDFAEQRFSSVFTGEEWFFNDRAIRGRKMFPAGCYIEMARAAVLQAAGTQYESAPLVVLSGIVCPAIETQYVLTAHIALCQDHEAIDFEIYSGPPAGANETAIVLTRGRASLVVATCAGSNDRIPALDLKALRLECERSIEARWCYEAFESIGIEYRATYRSLECVHVPSATGAVHSALCELKLPDSALQSWDEYGLHPTLFEGALQSCMLLSLADLDAPRSSRSSVRVDGSLSVDRIEILGKPPVTAWTYARRNALAAGGGIHGTEVTYDVDICDELGRIYVRVVGLNLSLGNIVSDSRTEPSAADDRYSLTTESSISVLQSTAKTRDSTEVVLKVKSSLIHSIARLLKLSQHEVDEEAEFSALGFDSISLTKLSEDLNRLWGVGLNPSHFFAHPTVNRFADYLVEEHRARIVRSNNSSAAELLKAMSTSDACESGAIKDLSSESRSRIVRTKGAMPQPGTRHKIIAVIGMSGAFPAAGDLDIFWENLKAGKDCITEIPLFRWDWRDIYGDAHTEANKTSIKWGGFIDGIDEFDPLFFGISPREAELMDPQQRLLMTHGWQAIEDAGYSAASLSGTSTGVFVGTGSGGYGELIANAKIPIEGYSSTGVVSSVGPNRLSFFLNLHGPSEPIETACSSSLVAIHRAVRAMQCGDCTMALAGGINTILTPWAHVSFDKAGMLAKDGRCKTFASTADGYVRGEGVGMLFLKDLSAATRDRDHIYGLIRGSAENHGGRANSLTAPNSVAQSELLKAAFQEAKIDPRDVTYIEAHGTGTPLGDPIEISGLKHAFKKLYASVGAEVAATPHCGIGSVKSNIGHLELAAGVAGVIKVLLQLKHKTLVASLHCETINPYIQLQDSPFYFVRHNQPWLATQDAAGRDRSRMAGVSSFGFGGTNAHIVIEEYCEGLGEGLRPIQISQAHPALVVLSAKNEERLQERARQLLAHIRAHGCTDAELGDIAYTLQVGREAMGFRIGIIATTMGELEGKLLGYVERQAEGEEGGEYYLGEVKKNREALSIFDKDEAFQQTIQTWIRRSEYAKLLELWVKGLVFDWRKLYGKGSAYGDNLPRRVSLPTYPFARERYWVKPLVLDTSSDVDRMEEFHQEKRVGLESRESGSAEVPSDKTEQLMFAEAWEERPLDSSTGLSSRATVVVVLLSNAQGQADVATAVTQCDAQTHLIFISQSMTDAESDSDSLLSNTYRVMRSEADSYNQVFSRITREHGQIDSVWYLWSLEDASCIKDQAPIVHLIQGLSRAGVNDVRIILAGEYRSALERCYVESWIGYGRSLRGILPGVRMEVIQAQGAESGGDENVTEVSRSMEAWGPRLWKEFRAEKMESALYIRDIRHILRIKPIEMRGESVPMAVHPGGTYLITGGLGGLGNVLAMHLAKQYCAKLILTGRSALNKDIEAKLKALEDLGGQAIYIIADVSNLEQMRMAIAQGQERMGELCGVIHAAGIESTVSLLTKDMRSVEVVLAPKVTGTLVLDELLKEHKLEFICYFSSSSVSLGDFGSCDYAVGNRFELAHAKYVSSRAIAICWPMWADGHMGSQDIDAMHLYLKASGQRALGAAEGIAILENLLARRQADQLSHSLVMVGNRTRVYQILGLMSPARPLSVQLTREQSEGHRADLQGLTIAQCVLSELKELASDLLKTPREKLDAEENLADFGFDSIGLAAFAQRLSAHMSIKVLPSVFFSHTTLRKVANYLIAEYAETVQRLYSDFEGSQSRGRPQEARVEIAAKEASRLLLNGHSARSMAAAASPMLMDVPESIAVIGMSGRFPKARTVDELWQILTEGKTAVEEIPVERFDWRHYYQAPSEKQGVTSAMAGKMTGKWLGMVPGVEEFDPLFFEISPKEAELMDPRQRLLLQESFNALEDAGYGAAQLERHKIGMFVGVEQGDYQVLVGGEGNLTGNHDAILASRLSYFLNLRGPTMAINTACSSGLVAVHQACLSLRAGECDTAMAASVSLTLTPQMYIGMSQAGMLSSDGKCYAFDLRANGLVPGEAAVTVVLKRLSQAEADGDFIYALIRGSGINYDGKTNGMTAPSGIAQTELIKEVYQRARVTPGEIEYIVTHGTGTRLGDPVEINALRDAFKDAGQGEPHCALTSTKTNVGHTFAASGLVSLVSLVQALRHETIPASLHCEQLSDYIDWTDSPFYVNRQNKTWPRKKEESRLGAISAFGMSGTNAHVVLESYEKVHPSIGSPIAAPYYLLALSAKTEAALQQRAHQLLSVLKQKHHNGHYATLTALSHTLLAHRQHFAFRCALVIEDSEQAIRVLEKMGRSEKQPALLKGKIARDFAAQPMLMQYAEDLLRNLCTLYDDPGKYQQSLAVLADLYCQGYPLNWQTMYGDLPPQRLTLPTYPFARDRYWIQEFRSLAPPCPTVANDALQPNVPMGPLALGEKNSDIAPIDASVNSRTEHTRSVIKAAVVLSLKCDIASIDSEEAFSVYGMDSIIGSQLVAILRTQLNLDIDMNEIWLHNTITKLTAHVLGSYPGYTSDHATAAPSYSGGAEAGGLSSLSEPRERGSSSDTTLFGRESIYDDRAIRCIKKSSAPEARVLIFFCFGFGVQSYKWVSRLPTNIEVWTVGTTDISNWKELVIVLARDLPTLFDKPIIVWGHSMGSNVAFEVLHYLEMKHGLTPKMAIFSSASSPAAFARSKYTSPFYEIRRTMSDEDLEQHLLDNHFIIPRRSWIPFISPTGLRNDVELIKSYEYDHSKRLTVPLYLVQANNDAIVSDASVVIQWENISNAGCHYVEIEGTHLFFMDPPKQFINLIVRACRSEPGPGVDGVAGAYELVRLTVGTQDLHLFPFGSSARGYILYGDAGQMAAHMWHPNRPVKRDRPPPADEAAFTYVAYDADYRYLKSTVDHEIAMSTIPGQERKTLRRYVESDGNNLILSTSPVVMKCGNQEELAGHQEIVWKRMPDMANTAAISLAGCWELISIRGAKIPFLNDSCRGRCIITSNGLVSVIVAAPARPGFAMRNPLLATDEELVLALESVFSWLGQIEAHPLLAQVAETLVWQAPSFTNMAQVDLETCGESLKIHWRDESTERPPRVTSEWRRRESAAHSLLIDSALRNDSK